MIGLYLPCSGVAAAILVSSTHGAANATRCPCHGCSASNAADKVHGLCVASLMQGCRSLRVDPRQFALAGEMRELWPLAEGTIITQLLGSEQPQDSAVAKVVSFYHMLLLVVPDWDEAFSQGQGRIKGGLSSALVSGLAFGCNILQGLWRCAWHAMHPALLSV